jgi:hypothetical protein
MLYKVTSGAMPTTAASVPVATGTAIKTLLQVLAPAAAGLAVVEWGISFEGSTAGTPIRVELVETGTVAATVTAHATSGVQRFDAPAGPSSAVQLGTVGTGYNASAEGTITTTRHGDLQLLPNTAPWVREFTPGREFRVSPAGVLRVRVTAAASVNAYAYVVYAEGS